MRKNSAAYKMAFHRLRYIPDLSFSECVMALCTLALCGCCVAASSLEWGAWRGLFKMAASTGFLLTAWRAGALESGFGRVLFSGLVLSWLGDFLIMGIGPGGFLSGLTAFLLAHLAYSIAFLIAGIRVRRSLIAFGALSIFGLCVAVRIFPGVPATLRFPVGAYMIVISAMVSLAMGIEGAKSRTLVIAGALLFYFSDLFVARAFFVQPGFVNTLIGLPLYYSGQTALALSGSGESADAWQDNGGKD